MNNQKEFPTCARRFSRLICLIFLPTFFAAQVARAQDFTLTDNNSSIGLNLTNGGFGPAGLTSWLVDGVNQLNRQSFFYRVGSGQEYTLDNISSTPFVNYSSSSIDVTYSNSSFSVKLTYDLFGNPVGSQKSGLGYSVQILNKQATTLDFHLFQYSDYDLGGIAGSQNVVLEKITGGPVSLQKFKSAGQTMGGMWMTNVFSLTSLPGSTPLAEAGLFDTTLQSLTDAGQTMLNNATTAGPGNVSYAIQWDLALNAGTSASLSGSFDMQVPEPSALAIFAVAMLGWAGMSARRKTRLTPTATGKFRI